MSTCTRLLSLLAASALLAACGDKSEPDAAAADPAATPAPTLETATPARGGPDFGGTTQESREAEGIGSTPELAVLAALQSAIAQVNGVRVGGQLEQLRAGLSVAVDGHHEGAITADAFAQQVVASSQGAVLGYQILSQEEIEKVDAEIIARVRASDRGILDFGKGRTAEGDLTARSMRSYWKVRIKADVAKYRAPDEQGRPKIVVAAPRVLSASYAVGDNRVASDEVANAIRARLNDTLTQTKRFIVLDREFGDEMQAEIDHINSGNVRLADTARLGQQLATDLILIPTIERFEYPRSTRQLRMSDRQVTSYSGGGRITLRLINATTGEVVMSDSFDHSLASTGPSTLPRVVNGKGMAGAMMDSLSGQIGNAVVTGIFPISVVSLTGDQVVLSQGGDMLREGQRYEAVQLGQEMKDPQTGRSLGRAESPCCTIRVDRVAAQMSYGTIEDASSLQTSRFEPGSIELRQQVKPAKAEVATAAPRAAAKPAAKPAAPKPPAEDPNW